MTATGTAQGTGSSLIVTMANRYGLEPGKFYNTLEKTILPSNKQATQEQVAAFLVVANHYQLNPFIKEIFAFPSQSGGITPIVSVDGWLTIINRQPNLDGIEYQDHLDPESGELTAITCRIYRKDRSRPNEVTEYMKECRRNTPTWAQWPSRMLRHKALIQCARQAFGLAGIYDPDEAERIAEGEANSNGGSVAEKTKAKIEEMKQRYTPAEDVAESTTVDIDVVEETAADESDVIEGEAVIENEATDPVESFRANVQSLFDELPASAQKNVLAGKPTITKMDVDELNQMLIDIRKIQ